MGAAGQRRGLSLGPQGEAGIPSSALPDRAPPPARQLPPPASLQRGAPSAWRVRGGLPRSFGPPSPTAWGGAGQEGLGAVSLPLLLALGDVGRAGVLSIGGGGCLNPRERSQRRSQAAQSQAGADPPSALLSRDLGLGGIPTVAGICPGRPLCAWPSGRPPRCHTQSGQGLGGSGQAGEVLNPFLPPPPRPTRVFQSSYPVWEDFSSKASKLHSQLRTTILAAVAFLEAFQRVADMATNARGATRDIGSALTRMCMRHRSIETKLRHFTNALMESLIGPLQERIEDWKKTANQLDKDHAKEYKRARHEIKRKSSDTLKLQKKARKELPGRGDRQPQLDSALQDVSDLCLLLEETERQAVRRALVEERGRFCTFVALLQPVVNGEITMLGEITHLQGIVDDLVVLAADPHKLPTASEQVIEDLKGSDYSWSYQTPPSSPSSSGSRKSSMCSAAQPVNTNPRLSSVSSHDSGFISQDAVFSKPPSPMPLDLPSQKSSSSASSEASETCQSVSECSSPTSDWARPPPYEPLGASAPQRRKDRVELLREGEPGLAPPLYPGLSLEEGPRPRLSPASIAAKHGEEVSPAASDLAMVLTHGLSLEHQRSSRDSLQFSSGYSTQTSTPSCSEDTLPSQGSEYDCCSVNGDAEGDGQHEFDRSSTVPRNSSLAQSYRRMIQTKRPASTAGLPAGTAFPAGTTPGVATIRRTPSTKPTVRRTVSSAGPIPIRPPIVPVKTPTVPDSPGHAGPLRMGSEECVFYADDACSPHGLDVAKASPKRLSLPNASWGGSALEASAHGGAGKPSAEEQQQLAANRHSLVEKIGELVAGAHALGDGQFPFPTGFSDPGPEEQTPQPPPAASSEPPAEDMLVAIRRGVRLRRTVTHDRSAPRFL